MNLRSVIAVILAFKDLETQYWIPIVEASLAAHYFSNNRSGPQGSLGIDKRLLLMAAALCTAFQYS